jgi:imidazolonepropionase-like amidohydrolase
MAVHVYRHPDRRHQLGDRLVCPCRAVVCSTSSLTVLLTLSIRGEAMRYAALLLSTHALALAGCALRPAGDGSRADVTGAAVVYEGARLVPGTGAPAIEPAAFVVEQGVITQVGRAGQVTAPAAARRVDLSGKTVIPALIGAHGHPGYQSGLTFSSEVYSRELLLADLDRAAYFGVGTVLSMGIDAGDLVFQIREETASGLHAGARMLTAGRGIGAPNAGPGFATWAGIAYEVTDEAAGREAVRELAAQGVDLVKIWVDDRGGRAPALSAPVYRAIIDEARRHDLSVTAHVYYHRDAIELVEAGIHAFAHLPRDQVVSDELVAAIVARGVYVMPNLGSSERSTQTEPPWADDPHLLRLLEQTIGPEVLDRVRRAYESRSPQAAAAARERYAILEQSTAKLAAAGARLVLGPDTGLSDHFFGYAEQRELELMVRAGMTAGEAIAAATSQAAAYLGRADLGSLIAGNRADFLVLDADPLDDIRNTRRITSVYLNGREMDREALRTRSRIPSRPGARP